MRGIIIRYKVSDVQGFNNFMENSNVESYIQDFTNKIYKEVYKKVYFLFEDHCQVCMNLGLRFLKYPSKYIIDQIVSSLI